jgi:hypothetical protein
MKIIEIANNLGIINLNCDIKKLKILDKSKLNTKSDLQRFNKTN